MHGLLTVLLVVFGVWTNACQGCKNSSHVVTDLQELLSQSGGLEFKSNHSATNFSELLLDDSNGNLIIGARNLVIQISLDNFTSYKVLKWPSSSFITDYCIQSRKPSEECHNFVQVLQPFEGRLFVCGTNAYRPMCKWRNLTDLSDGNGPDSKGNVFGRDIDGVGLVPYSPRYRSTAIMSDIGRYYAGTMMDGAAREPVIFSRDFKFDFHTLGTVRGDNKWLSDSEFVKSFDVGLYVYFFFLEAAVENMKCGKTRFSRVARICKGDYGGSEYVMKNTFITYNKARLNCSTTGEYPAYYDQIQDVFWDGDANLFYAVFTTQANSVAGSAVCAYTLDEMERVFNSDYKFRDDKTGEWSTKTNQHHFANCSVKASSQSQISSEWKKQLVPEGLMATPIMTQPAFDDSKRYQLMDGAVQPNTTDAQYIKHGQRFSTIAVDHLNKAVVMYIGTEHGSVLKLYKPNGQKSACVIEEIRLFKKHEGESINSLKIDSRRGALYAATDSKLIKIDLNRCRRHTDKKSCVVAHDPYCGWSTTKAACTPWNERNPGPWEQDLTQCPVAPAKWSKWSSWSVCRQTDGNVCQCRTRTCHNTCNHSDCKGEAIELKTCTVNKSNVWTDEATWLREGVINGDLSTWSPWSACSVTQGSGSRMRRRSCSNPVPRNGGRQCSGNTEEVKSCHVSVPPQEKTVTLTSGVLGVVGKDDVALRQRYTCRVRGYDLHNMSLTLTKTEDIDCMQHRDICNLPTDVPIGVWGTWSDWTKCRLVGMKHRARSCLDKDKACQGLAKQDRECDVITQREVTTPTTTTTTKPTTPPAPDLRWGSWSMCRCNLSVKFVVEEDQKDPVGLQHRSRRCRETHPEDERCNQDRVEYKICFCESTEPGVYARTVDETVVRKARGYRLGDVVGAAIVTGVLCIVLCAVLAYCLVRRKKKFNVSRAQEKSMNESQSDSRYERTNGVEYPSKDRNSSAKLHPVDTNKSFKDFFMKSRSSPEAV